MSLAAMLLVALILDRIFGEPDWLWRRFPHPAVLMGHTVDALETRLNTAPAKRAKGVIAVAILVIGGGALGWVLSNLAIIGPAFSILGAAILLAHHSLIEHVRAVETSLSTSLKDGRAAVSMIVGRDPQTLDETGVARASIESAAENFSDGVIAPAFWFLIAGLPGILVYKAINTADSMIGHRSERYRDFGWAAARLDDLLNLIPARITGALIAVAAGSARALQVMWRDARLHKSPNAGWPEAAMAASLDLRLAGPRIYDGALTDDPWINAEGSTQAMPADIARSLELLQRSWLITAATIGVMATLIQGWSPESKL